MADTQEKKYKRMVGVSIAHTHTNIFKHFKYFLLQKLGDYMFRIDENRIIDATLNGNFARFINHSCEPNCMTEKIELHNETKIIVSALRAIKKNTEVLHRNIENIFN